jgi:hypothetical protein
MARKPNYKFERMERERAKAAKKAARAQAKAEKAEQKKLEKAGQEVEGTAPDEENLPSAPDPQP